MSKVSVIIPCFNQGKYISEAIESVINQSYLNWECIIVNDGSTDETEKIAYRYKKQDSRFKYFFQKNSGLPTARNNGIARASGDYILPLDSDDKIGKDYLEEGVEVLQNNSHIKIVYALAEKFGEESGNWILPEYNFRQLLLKNCIYCTALFRKSSFIEAGGYNINMKYGWEDWDLWISMLKSGGEVYRIPKVHFYYRIRSKSMVRSFNFNKKTYLRNQLFQNHHSTYIDYFGDPISAFIENNELKKNIARIKKSKSFIIGFAITWPIRVLKRFFNSYF